MEELAPVTRQIAIVKRIAHVAATVRVIKHVIVNAKSRNTCTDKKMVYYTYAIFSFSKKA